MNGQEVMAQVVANSVGFGDFQTDVALEHTARGAHVRELGLRLKVLEAKDGTKRRKIEVQRPAVLQGLTLLMIERAEAPPERWVHAPRLGRTMRLADVPLAGPLSENRDAFEDFSAATLKEQTFTILREESCNGAACYVLKALPKDPDGPVPESLLWIRKEGFLPEKIETLDGQGDVERTLHFLDYRRYEPGYWRPGRIEVANYADGRTATVTFQNISFGNGFQTREFERRSLELP